MHDTEVAHSKDKDQDVELVARSMENQSVTQPPHQHHMDHLTGTDQQEMWSTHYLMSLIEISHRHFNSVYDISYQ